MWVIRLAGFALALMFCAAWTSCKKPRAWNEEEKFFVDWLQRHGEKQIVVEDAGVGIAGNATRLRAAIYGANNIRSGQVSVEMEFRIKLPSDGEILEYVAGVGDTEAKARTDCLGNFILSTFHVVYKSFINPADPHQTLEPVTILGRNRSLARGNLVVRSEKNSHAPALGAIETQIRDVITKQPLDSSPHWIKVVYGQIHGKPMTVAATLDNRDDPVLTAAIAALAWPAREEFYMAKQFIVIP